MVDDNFDVFGKIWDVETEWNKAFEEAHLMGVNLTDGPKISTITIMYKTKNVDFNLLQMIRDSKTDDGKMLCGKYIAGKKNDFYNSVLLHTTDNKGIKVFSNGNIHMTGCKSFSESFSKVQELVSQINEVVVMSAGSNVIVSGFSIQMVNIILKTDKMVLLSDFFHALVETNDECTAKFDPNVYSGLIVKFPSQKIKCSLTYFSTGTIFCNGVHNVEGVRIAFKHIRDHFQTFSFKKEIVIKVKGKRGRKRKADHDAFYDALVL